VCVCVCMLVVLINNTFLCSNIRYSRCYDLFAPAFPSAIYQTEPLLGDLLGSSCNGRMTGSDVINVIGDDSTYGRYFLNGTQLCLSYVAT